MQMPQKTNIWQYLAKYSPFIALAVLFMGGEVFFDLMQPALMQRVIDEGVIADRGTALLLRLGLTMIFMGLLGGICGSMNNLFVNLTSQNSGNLMRMDCFRRIMGMSFSQVEGTGAGTLITRMTNDISQVQNMIALFIRGEVRTLSLLGGSLYFLFRIDRTFGIIVTCSIPLLLGCLILCISRVRPLFTLLQERLDSLNGILQEDISGIRVIKACVREAYEQMRFGKANSELVKTQLKILMSFAMLHPAMHAIMHTVAVLILYFGFGLFRSGRVSPGGIMAALTYSTQLLNGILMLTMLFHGITRGRASWQRVKALLATEPGIAEGEGAEPSQPGQLELRDVSFRYPGMDKDALSHISLTLTPGKTTAIVGSTGSGKTTLLNLILRFYDANEGQILLEGADVRKYSFRQLRDNVAYALQRSELFNASIRDNIAFGNSDLTQEQIQEAANIAQAQGFIEGTPEGYDTKVAERGARLSGGQKQRIALARAIAKGGNILLLDDATSALDLKTEAAFYSALSQARPGLTKLIVAQRIASIKNADKIVVLHQGRIADQGTHAELLQRCELYKEICQSQLDTEEVANG